MNANTIAVIITSVICIGFTLLVVLSPFLIKNPKDKEGDNEG